MVRGKPTASEAVEKAVQAWGKMASETKTQLGMNSAIRARKHGS